MKKISLILFALAMLPLNSCKENATEKINQDNVEKAAERDAQTIVFPTINFDKTLHDFGEIQVLKGPYGPYIKYNKKNFKIPKNTDTESLDKVTCEQIISEAPPPRPKRKTKAS